MSQSGFTPIQLYRSSTAAAAPLAADLAAGELAINTTDEKLYFENTGGTVTLLASSAATGGTFTTVTATTVVNGLGAVGTPSYTFTGDLNTGMWSPAADTVAVSTAGAEVLRLTAAGLVGISDGAPTRKLSINAIPASINQLNGISINSAGSATSIAEFLLGTDGSGIPFTSVRTGNDSNSFMNFFTGSGPAERMRISAAGNVGIGTTTPGARLEVNTTNTAIKTSGTGSGSILEDVLITRSSSGTTIQSGPNITFSDGTANNTATIQNSQGNLGFWNFGSAAWVERMRISSAGLVGIGTSAPAAPLDVTASLGSFSATGNSIQRLTNSSATGQSPLDFFINGTLRGRFRSDFAGNMSYVTNGGAHSFYVGGDSGVGSVAVNILASGDVGIGTLTPTRRLSISGGDVELNANVLYLNSGNAFIQGNSTNILFSTNATERMRIDSSGNVGIGTTAPGALLDVRGSVAVGATVQGIIRRSSVQGSSGVKIQGNIVDTINDTNPGASVLVGGGSLSDGFEGNIVLTAYGTTGSADRNTIQFQTRSGTNTVAERMRISSDWGLRL
jgi:hypothetical protein